MSHAPRQGAIPALILIAAATLFTVGRSVIVARTGMRLSPGAALAPRAGGVRVVAASAGPDMDAINRDLSHGDAMRPGPAPRANAPAPPAVAPSPKPAAPPAAPVEALRLVGLSADFAIVRDANGDHSVRLGGRMGKYTLRQISGSAVILESDRGDSITLSHSNADRQ